MCQSVKSNPPKFPLNPWLWPSKPWSRVHLEFAGPLLGKTYLVAIDAHSKVFSMQSTTSIQVLQHLFPCYGLLDQINGTSTAFMHQMSDTEIFSLIKLEKLWHTTTKHMHPLHTAWQKQLEVIF